MRVKTYDIINAGPRNRFCVNGRIVKNSGRGPQPQNLKNHGPECFKCQDCGRMWAVDAEWGKCPECGNRTPEDGHEWGNTAAEWAIRDAMGRNLRLVEELWGNAIELISSCLRSLYVAAPGYDLICSDYNAIEAVGLAALAREEWRLEVFRTHGKIYEASAARAFNVPLEEILNYKKTHGKHHPLRKKGKVRELSNGYQGWINANRTFGATGTDDEIKADIIKWREESPNIVELWGGQWRKHPYKWEWWPERYGVEGMAVSALENPEYEFKYLDLSFRYDPHHDVLFAGLPSGRPLCYHKPRLERKKSPAGNVEWGISFFGRLGDNTGNWGRRDTYSGRMVENITQAACRDIMAAALVRVDNAGYRPVLHVHDEIVAEIPKGWGSVDEFEALMMQREEWFKNWPIRASGGWRGYRFRK